jgi:hypothetical protein
MSEALVSGYEHLVDQFILPDPKDRHVLAGWSHQTGERGPRNRLWKHGLSEG